LIAVSPILFGALLLASAASAQTNSKRGPANVVSSAAPAAIEIPQSVFDVPSNEKEGKDPFFPRSRRPYAVASVPVVTNRVPVLSDLRINGTSGSEERPLVIINNVTFGVGDTGEVIAGNRRVKVRCLEIDLSAGTATVQAGDERRILRFRRTE
jgi:hypothetical protein